MKIGFFTSYTDRLWTFSWWRCCCQICFRKWLYRIYHSIERLLMACPLGSHCSNSWTIQRHQEVASYQNRLKTCPGLCLLLWLLFTCLFFTRIVWWWRGWKTKPSPPSLLPSLLSTTAAGYWSGQSGNENKIQDVICIKTFQYIRHRGSIVLNVRKKSYSWEKHL